MCVVYFAGGNPWADHPELGTIMCANSECALADKCIRITARELDKIQMHLLGELRDDGTCSGFLPEEMT